MVLLKIDLKKGMVTAAIAVCMIALAIIHRMNILLSCCLLIWIIAVTLSFLDIKNNIAIFCFLISFFVFLLGRQVVYSVFDRQEVYSFLNITNNKTYFLLLVSLISVCLGTKIAPRNTEGIGFIDRERDRDNYAVACRIVYYICYLFSIVQVLFQIVYVRRVGYLASYTVDAGGAGIPSVVYYFSSFTPVALSLYLATFPPRNSSLIELAMFEVYGGLSMLTGQRYPFVGISMFVLSYVVIRSRHEEGWVKRRYYAYAVIALPLLIILLTAFDSIRLGQSFTFRNIGDTIITFLDQQGGSINTIRRTIYNAKELKDMHFVSFQGTYSALFENFLARRLFGVETYSGNSIERAMAGHDLSARLSWIAYGDGYLNGLGTGSSFVAELFHDFGAVGVILGSLFYGVVLGKVSRIEPGKKLKNGIGLAMMYYLFLSPRGGFDSFVGSIFRIYSLFFFFIIILIAWVLNSIGFSREKGDIESEKNSDRRI